MYDIFKRSHFIVLALTTLLSIIACVASFASGNFIVIQNLIYIPILIACIYYEKRGFVFSVSLSLIHFILVVLFTKDPVHIVHAFARSVFFVIVASVTTGLSLAKLKEAHANQDAHTLLKRVIDAATKVSIIATDTSGTILMFNSGSQHMLGYTAEEMIGKQTPCVIHLESEVAERSKELTEETGRQVKGFDVFVEYAKQGKHDERKWTYVKKDGKHISVNLIVTPVKDDKGAITGFLGIATDITEREVMHKAMREVESKFSAIVENAPDGIIFCELATHNIIFSNAAMTKLFGYSAKEFLAMKVRDLHRNEDWNSIVQSQFERHIRGEISISNNIPAARKDGELIYVDITSGRFNISGKKYFTAIFRDAAERNRQGQ